MTTDKEQQIDELVNNQMRHHRRPDDDDSRERMMLQIRNILNILFLIMALSAVITYFVADFKTFLYVCGVAFFFKLMEFYIRFTNR